MSPTTAERPGRPRSSPPSPSGERAGTVRRRIVGAAPAGPVRDRRGVGAGRVARTVVPFPSCGSTSRCRSTWAGARCWSTTPRPWPRWPSSPGTAPSGSADGDAGGARVDPGDRHRSGALPRGARGGARDAGGRDPAAGPASTASCRPCWSVATEVPGSTPADSPPPYAPAPLAAVGATCGVGIVVALPGHLVRHRRDGPDRPVHGRRERRPVRPVRLRPARHRRGPRARCGRAGRCRGARPDRAPGAPVDGRGACRHPDGVVRLVRSALPSSPTDARPHAAGRPCPGHTRPSVLTLPAEPAPAGRAS